MKKHTGIILVIVFIALSIYIVSQARFSEQNRPETEIQITENGGETTPGNSADNELPGTGTTTEDKSTTSGATPPAISDQPGQSPGDTPLGNSTSGIRATERITQKPGVIGNNINVKNVGAVGDGVTDDTTAIQDAVDLAYSQGGGTVYIPGGTYSVNPDQSIKLRSNVNLTMASNAILKARASADDYYNIVLILNANNVQVSGGKIAGERYRHMGNSGEWGSGIGILGSTDVKISGVTITDCWGDGIFIGPSWPGTDNFKNYSDRVTIEDFYLYNNRRQGISVISARNLVVRNGEACKSNGTRPESGIDLEPDKSSQFLQNILIENVVTRNNAIGILVALTNVVESPNKISVTIKNTTDYGSPYPISFYKYYESENCKIRVYPENTWVSSYS